MVTWPLPGGPTLFAEALVARHRNHVFQERSRRRLVNFCGSSFTRFHFPAIDKCLFTAALFCLGFKTLPNSSVVTFTFPFFDRGHAVRLLGPFRRPSGSTLPTSPERKRCVLRSLGSARAVPRRLLGSF